MNRKEKLLKDWNGGISRGAQRRLACMLKLNEASVSSWLSGRALPSEGNILKMSRIFKKPSEEITDIFAAERKRVAAGLHASVLKGAAKDIPVLSAAPAGGDFFTLNETPEVYLPVKKSAEDNAFAIKITSDAMVDKKDPQESIYPGDYAIIIPGKVLKDGAVALIRATDGKYVVRRYYKKENTIELSPANPKYKTLKYALYEAEVMGHIAHIHRPVVVKPQR